MWNWIANTCDWLCHGIESPLRRLMRYARWQAGGRMSGIQALRGIRELVRGHHIRFVEAEDADDDTVLKALPLSTQDVNLTLTYAGKGKPVLQSCEEESE